MRQFAILRKPSRDILRHWNKMDYQCPNIINSSQKILLLPQTSFLRPLIHRQGQGQVLDYEAGGVKYGDLLGSHPARLLAGHDIP
jgi:hypothetical protein